MKVQSHSNFHTEKKVLKSSYPVSTLIVSISLIWLCLGVPQIALMIALRLHWFQAVWRWWGDLFLLENIELGFSLCNNSPQIIMIASNIIETNSKDVFFSRWSHVMDIELDKNMVTYLLLSYSREVLTRVWVRKKYLIWFWFLTPLSILDCVSVCWGPWKVPGNLQNFPSIQIDLGEITVAIARAISEINIKHS